MEWRSLFARPVRTIFCLVLGLSSAGSAVAEEPLATRIDQLVRASAGSIGVPVALASDEEFARRLYLDLTGAVPSGIELRAFLADPSPQKRAELIDRLIASPLYARHMAVTFDVMLMERRPEKHVKADEWHKYLYDSFAQNKPWNQLAREILNADGTDEKIRAASRFSLDREGEPNALTRDIARMFFGMDLACCQCHDHPIVNSYLQSDYYGLYAFVSRSALITDKDKKVLLAERAEGDVKFTSVFTKQQDETRPRLPGQLELHEPLFLKGEDYVTAPAEGVRSVPKYSRRNQLAEAIASGQNRQFSRNIVNRLWALMMGRGLVEPVDMHHVDNPPSQPELLEMLTDDFVRTKYDMRAFLREVARSETYQLAIISPEQIAARSGASAEAIAQLEAESERKQQALSTHVEAIAKARAEYEAGRKAVAESIAEFNKANEAIAAPLKSVVDANNALSEAQQQVNAKRELATLVTDALGKLTAAATSRPQDPALTEAIQKFRERSEQLVAEIPTVEKLVSDRSAAVEVASTALAAAKTAAMPAIAKVSSVDEKLVPLEQQLTAMLETYRVEQTAAKALQAQVAAGRLSLELSTAISAAETAETALRSVEAEITANRAAVGALSAQAAAGTTPAPTSAGVTGEAPQNLAQSGTAVSQQLEELQKQYTELESKLAESRTAVEAARATRRAALENSLDDASKRFLTPPIEPLTPEQIGWSILKVTGVLDQYRAAAIAELDKAMPLDAAATMDQAKVAERERQIEQSVYDKLKGNVATFVQLFGHAGGQPQRDFFATVDQALFFSNAGVIQSWLSPGGENLVARSMKHTDTKAAAEELYVGVLSRRPTDEEVVAATGYLDARANDRVVAMQEIAWALITSTEFRFQ